MEDGRGDGLFAFDVPSCSAFLNTSPGSNSKQKLTVKSHWAVSIKAPKNFSTARERSVDDDGEKVEELQAIRHREGHEVRVPVTSQHSSEKQTQGSVKKIVFCFFWFVLNLVCVASFTATSTVCWFNSFRVSPGTIFPKTYSMSLIHLPYPITSRGSSVQHSWPFDPGPFIHPCPRLLSPTCHLSPSFDVLRHSLLSTSSRATWYRRRPLRDLS